MAQGPAIKHGQPVDLKMRVRLVHGDEVGWGPGGVGWGGWQGGRQVGGWAQRCRGERQAEAQAGSIRATWWT